MMNAGNAVFLTITKTPGRPTGANYFVLPSMDVDSAGFSSDWRPNSMRPAIVGRQTRTIEATAMRDPTPFEGAGQNHGSGSRPVQLSAWDAENVAPPSCQVS
jgi:hypothetical protein